MTARQAAADGRCVWAQDQRRLVIFGVIDHRAVPGWAPMAIGSATADAAQVAELVRRAEL